MSLLRGLYANTPLDTHEIPQATLNIEQKSRRNPLPWDGQFSPELVQALLCHRYVRPGTTVLDPFVGSGTVLLEAGRAGSTAMGVEINPAAVALARVYEFINLPNAARESSLQALEGVLRDKLPDPLPLFRAYEAEVDVETIKARLVALAGTARDHVHRIFFEALVVMLDFDRKNVSVDRVFELWDRLRRLVLDIPLSRHPIRVFHADARQTPLEDSTIDLVLTSPPYINVFNYHQRYRASMEALKWDLLNVAKSEIGANRKHRGNRFLTVIQFSLDMAQALRELARVCRPDARVIFVVGRESMVRGTRFFNGEIVTEVAHKALGFRLILRQERVFLNRYGQDIYEDILHLSPPPHHRPNTFLESARSVAEEALLAAHSTAPAQARSDIRSALTSLHLVMPSPFFDPAKAYRPSADREPNA